MSEKEKKQKIPKRIVFRPKQMVDLIRQGLSETVDFTVNGYRNRRLPKINKHNLPSVSSNAEVDQTVKYALIEEIKRLYKNRKITLKNLLGGIANEVLNTMVKTGEFVSINSLENLLLDDEIVRKALLSLFNDEDFATIDIKTIVDRVSTKVQRRLRKKTLGQYKQPILLGSEIDKRISELFKDIIYNYDPRNNVNTLFTRLQKLRTEVSFIQFDVDSWLRQDEHFDELLVILAEQIKTILPEVLQEKSKKRIEDYTEHGSEGIQNFYDSFFMMFFDEMYEFFPKNIATRLVSSKENKKIHPEVLRWKEQIKIEEGLHNANVVALNMKAINKTMAMLAKISSTKNPVSFEEIRKLFIKHILEIEGVDRVVLNVYQNGVTERSADTYDIKDEEDMKKLKIAIKELTNQSPNHISNERRVLIDPKERHLGVKAQYQYVEKPITSYKGDLVISDMKKQLLLNQSGEALLDRNKQVLRDANGEIIRNDLRLFTSISSPKLMRGDLVLDANSNIVLLTTEQKDRLKSGYLNKALVDEEENKILDQYSNELVYDEHTRFRELNDRPGKFCIVKNIHFLKDQEGNDIEYDYHKIPILKRNKKPILDKYGQILHDSEGNEVLDDESISLKKENSKIYIYRDSKPLMGKDKTQLTYEFGVSKNADKILDIDDLERKFRSELGVDWREKTQGLCLAFNKYLETISNTLGVGKLAFSKKVEDTNDLIKLYVIHYNSTDPIEVFESRRKIELVLERGAINYSFRTKSLPKHARQIAEKVMVVVKLNEDGKYEKVISKENLDSDILKERFRNQLGENWREIAKELCKNANLNIDKNKDPIKMSDKVRSTNDIEELYKIHANSRDSVEIFDTRRKLEMVAKQYSIHLVYRSGSSRIHAKEAIENPESKIVYPSEDPRIIVFKDRYNVVEYIETEDGEPIIISQKEKHIEHRNKVKEEKINKKDGKNQKIKRMFLPVAIYNRKKCYIFPKDIIDGEIIFFRRKNPASTAMKSLRKNINSGKSEADHTDLLATTIIPAEKLTMEKFAAEFHMDKTFGKSGAFRSGRAASSISASGYFSTKTLSYSLVDAGTEIKEHLEMAEYRFLNLIQLIKDQGEGAVGHDQYDISKALEIINTIFPKEIYEGKSVYSQVLCSQEINRNIEMIVEYRAKIEPLARLDVDSEEYQKIQRTLVKNKYYEDRIAKLRQANTNLKLEIKKLKK